MPRMTDAEYLACIARLDRQRTKKTYVEAGSVSATPDAGHESDLHDKIAAECRRRGWAYVHSRMDAPTTTTRGVPDFIIAARDGRTLWIECKSATGKQTPAQLGFALQCERNGHKVHLVRSFDEFFKVAQCPLL